MHVHFAIFFVLIFVRPFGIVISDQDAFHLVTISPDSDFLVNPNGGS